MLAKRPRAADKASKRISVKVRTHDGNNVALKVCIFCVRMWIEMKCIQNNCAQISKTTPLRSLLEAYCARVGAQTDDFQFLFYGEHIRPEDTPESVSDAEEFFFLFLSHNTDFRIFRQMFMEEDDYTIDAMVGVLVRPPPPLYLSPSVYVFLCWCL